MSKKNGTVTPPPPPAPLSHKAPTAERLSDEARYFWEDAQREAEKLQLAAQAVLNHAQTATLKRYRINLETDEIDADGYIRRGVKPMGGQPSPHPISLDQLPLAEESSSVATNGVAEGVA